MKIKTILLIGIMAWAISSCDFLVKGKHLFILSGQSNMARLEPNESFTPTVVEAFGQENVIVVKDALGAQPIRRWYRNWKPLTGDTPMAQADLYDTLMTKVSAAIEHEKIASVTFIWMQGERDAKEQFGEVYMRSLKGLHHQLSEDISRKDVNFIVGRLSDFDLENVKYPHWTMIRDAQVALADSNPRFEWVNTDDLNDGINSKGEEISNDLHMSTEGYKIMGRRFAGKAIQLINSHR